MPRRNAEYDNPWRGNCHIECGFILSGTGLTVGVWATRREVMWVSCRCAGGVLLGDALLFFKLSVNVKFLVALWC